MPYAIVSVLVLLWFADAICDTTVGCGRQSRSERPRKVSYDVVEHPFEMLHPITGIIIIAA